MNTLYSRFCKSISILTILFFILLLTNFILRLTGRILFFETWTPMDSHVILGLATFISFTVWLVLRLTYVVTKIIVIFVVLIITGYVFFLGLLGSVDHITYEKDGYEINVVEWRYFFTGRDSYYLKENVLTSVYIGSGEQSEEVKTTYYIENGIFHMIERYENGEFISHEEVELPAS